jgi:hypothetical protein
VDWNGSVISPDRTVRQFLHQQGTFWAPLWLHMCYKGKSPFQPLVRVSLETAVRELTFQRLFFLAFLSSTQAGDHAMLGPSATASPMQCVLRTGFVSGRPRDCTEFKEWTRACSICSVFCLHAFAVCCCKFRHSDKWSSYTKRTPYLSVRKRNIPTEKLPLVSEVSANICW